MFVKVILFKFHWV